MKNNDQLSEVYFRYPIDWGEVYHGIKKMI